MISQNKWDRKRTYVGFFMPADAGVVASNISLFGSNGMKQLWPEALIVFSGIFIYKSYNGNMQDCFRFYAIEHFQK